MAQLNHKIRQTQWFDDHYYKISFDKTDSGVDKIIEELRKKGITVEEKEQNFVAYLSSVTTRLGVAPKPWLAKWRGDVGNVRADQISRAGTERGSRIHNAWFVANTGGVVVYNDWRHPNYAPEEIEQIRAEKNGNLAVLSDQSEMYDLYKLSEWVRIVNPKFIESEKIVYDLEIGDAGQLDNVMFIEKSGLLDKAGKPTGYPISLKPVDFEEGYYIVDLKSGKNMDQATDTMQTASYAQKYEKMTNQKIMGTIILWTGSKQRKGIPGLGTIVRTREEMKKDYEAYLHISATWERYNKTASPKIFSFPSIIQFNLETKE